MKKETILKRVRRSRKGKRRWCGYIIISKNKRKFKKWWSCEQQQGERACNICSVCRFHVGLCVCVSVWALPVYAHVGPYMCHTPSSVIFHFIFWERVSLLNPELTDSAKLPDQWASRIYMIPHLPVLGLQTHVTIPGLYVGAGDPNSSTHTYTASTLTLSHLPSP